MIHDGKLLLGLQPVDLLPISSNNTTKILISRLGLGSRIRVRVLVLELGLVQGRGKWSFGPTVVEEMGSRTNGGRPSGNNLNDDVVDYECCFQELVRFFDIQWEIIYKNRQTCVV